MLYNLALKNVRTQFRNYFMYFVSMAFSVMVFYSFIAMSYDKTLIAQAGADRRIDATLKSASVIIVIFIVVFMVSANNFFVKRRKKEVGLYSLLGMRKSQIGRLFFLENVCLGLTGLIVGIGLGVLFSKLFSMILIRVMYLSIDSNFSISVGAIGTTTLMFLAILLFVSFKSASTVYRFKLIDLFKAEAQGDRTNKITFWTILFGIIGITMIGCGYYWASHFIDTIEKLSKLSTDSNFQQMVFLILLLTILVFCVAGTYLFFRNGLMLVIGISQKAKRHYYKNLNMVTTGNLRFHMRKNASTLATIAVLCGTAIAAIAGAAGVYTYGINDVNSMYPFSYTVVADQYDKLADAVKQAGGEITDKTEVNYKISAMSYRMNVLGDEVNTQTPINVISLTNYQEIQKNNPYLSDISLEENQIIVISSYFRTMVNVGTFEKETSLYGLDGKLQIKEISSGGISGGYTDYDNVTAVVSDNVYEKLSSEYAYQLIQFNVPGAENNKKLYTEVQNAVPEETLGTLWTLFPSEEDGGEVTFSMQEVSEDYVGSYSKASQINYADRYMPLTNFRIQFGVLIYIAVFIGIVLLVATGSIIMLKQLGEAEDEKGRYQILRKIGVQSSKIRTSIFKQNFFVFLFPMLIALLHAFFANWVLKFILPIDDYSLAFMACGALLVIYLIFYLITAKAYDGIVNTKAK